MSQAELQIEERSVQAFESVWPIVRAAIEDGEAIALPRDADIEAGRNYWSPPGARLFVALIDGETAGTFYLKPNGVGPAAHVANAGFATAPAFRGRGAARAMGLEALAQAKAAGFVSMRFNFVIATNEVAVKLWRDLGFEIVGTLPRAFRRPTGELADAYVMQRDL